MLPLVLRPLLMNEERSGGGEDATYLEVFRGMLASG